MIKIISRALLVGILLTAGAFAQTVTKLYVPSGTGSNSTVVIGLESQSMINQVSGAFEIGIAAANADSSEVWLFGEHVPYCNVINSLTDQVIRTIDINVMAEDVAFSPDGKYCFVVGSAPDKAGRVVMAIDCSTKEALYAVGGFSDPAAVVVSPDSKSFYAVSQSQGIVAKVSIPSFEVAKVINVGQEPVDLAFSGDGSLLFVACQGLANGQRGGSQVVVIDTRTDNLNWIFNDAGKALQSIALTPDLRKMVLTYREPQVRPQVNVRIYEITRPGEQFTITPAAGFLHGTHPSNGFIVNDGKTWIGADKTAGPIVVDLDQETLVSAPASLSGAIPLRIAAVKVDVEGRIRTLEAAMSTSTDSTSIADSYLDLAYLYATAGRKNDLVSTYNKVIANHPKSLAAITAGARMSDITHEQGLHGQTVEYSLQVLKNYADYLMNSEDKRQPQSQDILNSLDRLAEFDTLKQNGYMEQIASTYLKVSAKNPTLAEFYFTLGYHLQMKNETKLARRCFTEAESQIGTVQDRMAMLSLTARLALATGNPTAFYKFRDRKDDVVVDGNLDEWQKLKSLSLSGDAGSGYIYGPALWSGVNDLSASFYFGVSKEFLYVAGNVIDNTILMHTSDQSDAVRFYLDMRPASGNFFTRSESCSDGCFTITLNPLPRANLKANFEAAYQVAGQQSATGYSFEFKIPLSAFGKWYSPQTKRVGLGIEILDYDVADNPGLVKSLGFLLPTREPSGPTDPSLFGVAEF